MSKKYSAKDIKVLKPLEGVRTRPGMYIGSTDRFGLLQIVKEIVDNSIDESLAGHCDQIRVNLAKDGSIGVWDNGRGIPVEKHPDNPKKSTMEIIFTHLHAGGKLSKKGGAYSTGSRGCLHGSTLIELFGRTRTIRELYEAWIQNPTPFAVKSYEPGRAREWAVGQCIEVHRTKKVDELTQVTIRTGKKTKHKIYCTEDHPFLLFDGKYLEAEKLKPGQKLRAYHDKIRHQTGGVKDSEKHFNYSRVVKVKQVKLKRPRWVYDLTVKGEHNYLLGVGVFVHNTHGVGAAVTNALSTSFEVTTKRGKHWYYQGYERGVPTAGVVKKSKPKAPGAKGTLIRFEPDPKIFGKAKLPVSDLKEMLELAAYLHPKVTLTLASGRKEQQFHQPGGVKDLLDRMVKKTKSEPISKPLVVQYPHLDVVLQWTTHDAENINSYVCGSATPHGGTHLRGFNKALQDAIKPYRPTREKVRFRPEDLRLGLQGVINLTMTAPEFEGQTKGKLASADAQEIVYSAVRPELDKFFSKNKNMTRGLIKRAIELAEGRQRFVADRKLITALKTKKRGTSQLPAKLTQSTSKEPNARELYICEGDSAGGSAKQARNPKYQEVLCLSGKITNIYKDRKKQAFMNAKIIDVLKSIGFDPSVKDPMLKLRVGKIILLSDPDVDGKHINVLLLSLFQRVIPELYQDGRIYVIDAPLFNAHYRGKRYFGETRRELLDNSPSGLKPQHIQRVKGWGEINAGVLREIAFDKKTRKLTQVTELSVRKLPKFEAIVGENSAARKKLLGIG